MQNVDFSLSKEFPIPAWEQARIRFRAEFFNDTANATARRIQFSLQLRW